MTLRDIFDHAGDAYNTDEIDLRNYVNFGCNDNAQLKDHVETVDFGDPLARWIAGELIDTYDFSKDDHAQCREVVRVMDRGSRDLHRVSIAFDNLSGGR
jgi:hypothetical protein